VRKYFDDLADGDLGSALTALSPAIDFELPKDRWNQVIPYLGRHTGIDAVTDAFRVRAETTEVIEYEMRWLSADGDTAFAVIYTKGAHTRTGQVFEIEDTHRLVVGTDGKIAEWKVYFDPNGEIAAFNADREARLFAAVLASDVTLGAELVQHGADVNHRDRESGLTPLILAAGKADVAFVRLLLTAGADVLTGDTHGGATALHKACQGGSLDVVRALVEAGSFVNAVAPTTGHTPLMDALWFKHPDVVRYLLDAGAGLNVYTSYGFSLKQHFEYELNVNTVGKDKLLLAEKYLGERQASDADRIAAQRLMAAVTEGDVAEVERLIAAGAEIDERYPVVNGFNDAHTPLLVAARDGHTRIAELLLAAGADVNATEPTFGAVPLHKSVYNGHVELTRMIAARPGVDLDFQGATNGYTPLHDALWHGYVECAEILLDAGASLTLVGHDGKTPHLLSIEMLGENHPLTKRIGSMSAS
jgi:ankyrin repeat protein/ketosteroid isomerase-like protein